MRTIEYRNIDKAAWPRGEWDAEPDKKQWPDPATGLPCLAVRHSRWGNWCGYVGVPLEHPLHGKSYNEVDVEVHGGLTFSDTCRESGDPGRGICHLPDPNDPDGVWWFGFDCHHAFDYAPAFQLELPQELQRGRRDFETYRALPYVEAQAADLARQFADWKDSG